MRDAIWGDGGDVLEVRVDRLFEEGEETGLEVDGGGVGECAEDGPVTGRSGGADLEPKVLRLV